MLNSSFRYKRLAGGILDFGEDINDIVSKTGSDSGGISSHDGSKNDTDSDCNTEPWIISEFLHPSTEKGCSYTSRDSNCKVYNYHKVAGDNGRYA